MPESELPVSIGLWIAALAPLAAILLLLVGLRWKAGSAAPVGYLVAVLTAVLVYRTPLENVALQTTKGVWDAVFILYVIAPALLLYKIAKSAGAFASLRRGIESYTPNDLLHVLAFGWMFSSFLQGITGFGAPIAVTAPLLVAIGVQPLWAVVIPLIGHAWANTFGTLAVAWVGLTRVTTIPNEGAAALVAAAILLAANLLAGLAIAWIYGRAKGIREGLPAVLIISGIHSLGQLLLAPIIPTLAALVPASLAVAAVLWLARTGWYSGPSAVEDSPIMAGGGQAAGGPQDQERERMPLALSFAPYAVLVGLIVIVLLIPPVRGLLESLRVGPPFPEVETGYGVVTGAEESYGGFAPLTHPGSFLLASAIFAYVLYRSRGYIRETRIGEFLVFTVRKTIPSAVALLALVPLAKVLEGSGQVLELALGIASVATGVVYVFLAPLIGALGSFMAASNLSSNILFGPLQERTAAALGLAQAVVLGAQTAGGSIGNSIAPGNVLLGVGAVGGAVKVGTVLRKTILYALAAAVLAGAVAVLATLFFFPAGGE